VPVVKVHRNAILAPLAGMAFLGPLLGLSAVSCGASGSASSKAPDASSPTDAEGLPPDGAGAGIDAANDGPPGSGPKPSPDGGATTDASAGDAGCSRAIADPYAASRAACAFAKGAPASDTVGVTAAVRAAIPITHVIVITEENRSFDHFFGHLAAAGQPEAEGPPAGFANPDLADAAVAPYHLTSACLPFDPPHQGADMNAGWDHGKMDGFVKNAANGLGPSSTDGHFVMGYYDATDLPFFYWLATTFAIADHYFAPVLGGTWGNRDYLYCATSDGVTDTGQATISAPTIFDALDTAHVTWGVYTDGTPRQDCLGWAAGHAGVAGSAALISGLQSGNLPAVSFADPDGSQDEHPTNEIHGGELWIREIVSAAVSSPLWNQLAIVFTFDEGGGLADHVAPPAACPPSPDQAAFDQLGVRIPAIVVSPWAKLHSVSHVVHDHTSVLRLIESIFDLPALTARDANADALLDMFDFGCPARTNLPSPPEPGQAQLCP
jgi:phospholipase C